MHWSLRLCGHCARRIVMAKENKPISKALKTFFGIGDMGFSWMTNIETYYFAFFLTNIAKFPLALVSVIQTIGSVVDAALSWVYGIILNKMKPMKWGRYRSILVALPWMVPILYFFQFKAFGTGIGGAIIVIIGLVASHIIWNFPYVANVAIIGVAASTADDRNALSATRGMWTYVGRCLYGYVGPTVVALLTKVIGESNAYAGTAFAFAALMAAFYFAHFVMFKGYEETGEEEIARLKAEAAKKKEAGKKQGGIGQAIAANPQLLGVLISYTLYMMYSFCMSAFAVYYGNYVAKMPNFMTVFLMASNITAVIGSIVSKNVAKKFSSKGAYQIALIVIAALYVVAYLMRNTPIAVIVLLSIAGFFTAFTTIMVVPMLANCAIYSEYKTGVNCMGAVMGFLTVPIKIAVITRGLLITGVLAITGFDASIAVEEATDSVRNGIASGFTIIPAILVILALVVITLGYKLKDHEIEQYSAEIKARAAK